MSNYTPARHCSFTNMITAMLQSGTNHCPTLFVRLLPASFCALVLLLAVSYEASAYTITPQAWNIVGLDSNDVNAGPNRFPVGAKVCGGAPGSSVDVYFAWLSSNSYIDLRPGSKGAGGTPLNITFDAGGCADAFFEAEVSRNAAVYETSRQYKIYIGADSTPVPRELYAEHLISQSRNAITDVKVDGVSVPAGGSMNLVVGNTYTIDLIGGTATQGYNQFSSFLTLSNTIFQIISVSSTYSADNSPYVPNPVYGTGLYADACQWDNDTSSPTYRSCIGGDYKAGGSNVTTTYQIKIIGGGGTSVTLGSLLYDFSGASYHYNGDYGTSARIANIIDPASLNIAKGFFPNPSNIAAGSTLSFTITNPNAGALGSLSFTDPFPTSPGNMLVGKPLTGTVGVTNNSTNVTGNGTSFTTELAAGDSIIINGSTYTVSTVTNNTALTLTSSYPGTTATGLTAAAGEFLAGAVAVTTGSPSVTGTGTSFNSLAAGNIVVISGVSYVVASVASATSLTLTTNYAGTSASGLRMKRIGNTTCGGSFTDSSGGNLAVGDNGFRMTGGAVQAGGSCLVSFRVYVPATGTYNNATSVNLYSGTTDTGKSAAASLTVNTTAPPSPPASTCANPVQLAKWEINATTLGPPGTGPLVTSKAADVSSAFANYVAGSGGGQSVASIGGHTYAWSGTSAGAAGWAENPIAPGYTLNNYFEFVLDTSNYGGVGMTFDAALFDPGDWANPTSPISVTTSADGSAFSLVTPSPATIGKNNGWVSGFKAAAAATGTNTTSFRLAISGASKPAAQFVLDNVVLTGCPRIKPPTIDKQFDQNPILANGVSPLTFVLTNPNSIAPLSGVQFTDTFPTSPASMVVAGSSPALGTVTTNSASTAVTGSGTRFTTLLSPGAVIVINGAARTVASITDDTHLTLTANAAATGSGLAITGTASGCGSPTFAPGPGAGSISFSGGTIAPKGTCVVKVNVTAPTLGSYVNTSGAVAAAGTSGGTTATDTLVVSAPHPDIGLLKEIATSATPTLWNNFIPVALNDNVYYKLSLYNDGDATLSGITVADPNLPPGAIASCAWKDGDNNSISYPLTLQVANNSNNLDFASCIIGPVNVSSAGTLTNTATASVVYGGTTYQDTDYAIYATTGLTLAKSSSQNYYTAAGNTLNYSYLVTNSGFSSLNGPVTVTDDKTTVTCPAISSAGDLDNYFDPGESLTCTASYTVTAADVTAKSVTNNASASTPSVGSITGVTSNSASKTVPLAPDLIATKTNNFAADPRSNIFTWTITVANLASSGSAATFAAGKTILVDNLPSSGATYSLGTISTAGVTGTANISCSIDGSKNLICTASGGTVSLLPGLTGTVATDGTATVTGTGTKFLSELANGSIITIAGVPYTVISRASDTSLTLDRSYAGGTAGPLTIDSAITIPISVTANTIGSLVNPRSGAGMKCQVDTDPVPAMSLEISTANNTCSDTVVLPAPLVAILKSRSTGTAQPGDVVEYTVTITNSGLGYARDVYLSDDMSPYTAFGIDNYGAGVTFDTTAASNAASELTMGTPVYNIDVAKALVSGGGGAPAGYDATVTSWKILMGGFLKPDGTYTLKYKVKVK